MDGGAQYNPRTVEEVFRDFKGRRAAMIKALTTDGMGTAEWRAAKSLAYYKRGDYVPGLKELNVPKGDIEKLLVSLILDSRIQGYSDQVNKLLERSDR